MHTSGVSGKSYIGLTKIKPRKRWTQHTHAADSGSPFHFHSAIRLYGKVDWEHTILEEGIETLREAELKEMAYVIKYGTFENGYNRTVGGSGKHKKRTGSVAKTNYNRRVKATGKKRGQHRKDLTPKRFTHPNHGTEVCTRRALIEKYNIPRSGIHKLVRGERSQSLGWTIHPDDIIKPDSKGKTK
jgi:hypothetical protein